MQALAVVHDREVEGPRVLERAAHHHAVHDGLAIVGHCHAPGILQLPKLRELFALGPLRDCTDGEYMSEPRGTGLVQDELRHRLVVVHRRRVRHAADAGEAARDGCRRAGLDRLLVFEPRLAQMHVQVDESRQDPLAGGVQRGGTGWYGQSLTDLHDLSVLDQDVGRAVDPARVNDAALADNDGHFAPDKRYRTAMWTATPFATGARSTDVT